MVVDASVVLAVLLDEEDAEEIWEKLKASPELVMSPVNWWETQVRLWKLKGDEGRRLFEAFARQVQLEVKPVDEDQAEVAFGAFLKYGGRPAKLNLGDCFAYALAKSRGEGLLYKGEDFGVTDVNGTRLE